ncbi:hypothetical protein EVAR_28847_1 [Eumeta japonica]|uniref:Uncharacterized protein n=1 Tax=Eumeta variegata TaxID=151549 RepID=A0A4C1YHI9_EUMVA|nr:hypothetical protein EVAR_28847_1 [Eumeta japonica]
MLSCRKFCEDEERLINTERNRERKIRRKGPQLGSQISDRMTASEWRVCRGDARIASMQPRLCRLPQHRLSAFSDSHHIVTSS